VPNAAKLSVLSVSTEMPRGVVVPEAPVTRGPNVVTLVRDVTIVPATPHRQHAIVIADPAQPAQPVQLAGSER
jgi:hypothetical protein